MKLSIFGSFSKEINAGITRIGEAFTIITKFVGKIEEIKIPFE